MHSTSLRVAANRAGRLAGSRFSQKSASVRLRTPLASEPIGRRLSSTIHDNDPEVLTTEKARNLANQQHKTSTPHGHAPGWNEYIATSSEAHVKADKATGTIHEMQSESIKHVHGRHGSKGQDREAVIEEATYEKDSIEGPLKTSKGKEDVSHGNTASEDAVKADRGET